LEEEMSQGKRKTPEQIINHLREAAFNGKTSYEALREKS